MADYELRHDTLYTGDCLEVMAAWPAECIGAILTSPPYNVGLGYDGYSDDLPALDHRRFNAAWLAQAYRVAQDGARLYVAVSDPMLWWFRDVAEPAGWKFVQVLTWCKPNIIGSGVRVSKDWNIMSEPILLFRKGKRTRMIHAPTWVRGPDVQLDHGNVAAVQL